MIKLKLIRGLLIIKPKVSPQFNLESLADEPKKLVVNNLGAGMNLFDVKTFQTEESFAHLEVRPVVDDDEAKKLELSMRIKQYDSWTLENPFQGTVSEFISGKALRYLEEYVDEDRDIYLQEFLNVESEILRKINEYDGLQAKKKVRTMDRTQEILDVKAKLPVTLKELEIMDSVINSLVTIVCGETGSGKSTQIPQFLYETGLAGPGMMVGITQPRRLAAISLAQRVSEEMNTKLGDLVGYQVRYEASKFGVNTNIKFMTDGILLNEMMSDFLLSKYSVIVLDEAHERKLNTDLLIGLLSRVIRIRAKLSLKEREERAAKLKEAQDKGTENGENDLETVAGDDSKHNYLMNPLRLVIMSATLRVSDFTENKFLFPEEKINVINVEARMFPVKTYHNRETKDDYVEECLAKTVKIHTTLPKGAILVFLTGEEEIKHFCRKLQTQLEDISHSRQKAFYEIQEEDLEEKDYELKDEDEESDVDPNAMVLEGATQEASSQKPASEVKKPEKSASAQVPRPTNRGVEVDDYVICPLYTKLPLPEQQKVFKHAAETKRLIVVSTNVAETSLTIPNVKYVVDCGKEKTIVYNEQKTLGRFEIDWISQSSAKQREGRAGRTCAGFCYRVFSISAYNKMKEFSDPEILKEPLDSSILTLKTIGIEEIMKFPFVTKPGVQSILQAEKELVKIGALTEDQKITALGTSLSQFPIKPRLGKLLLMSRRAGMLGFGILLCTSLSAEEIFDTRELKDQLKEIDLKAPNEREGKKMKKALLNKFKELYKGFVNDKSDLITESNIMGKFLRDMLELQQSKGSDLNLNQAVLDYCRSHKLLYKSMRESYSLLLHLLKITEVIVSTQAEQESLRSYFSDFAPLNKGTDVALMTELICAIMIDKVGRRVKYTDAEGKEKEAIETLEHEVLVSVHPSSFVFSNRPELLIYSEVIESTSEKIFLARVTELDKVEHLIKYDMSKEKKVEFSKDNPTVYDQERDQMMQYARCSFGPKLWTFEKVYLPYTEESRDKYLHFCLALLQGKVFPGLKVLVEKYTIKLVQGLVTEPKALEPLVSFLQSQKIEGKKKVLAYTKKHESTNKLRDLILALVDKKYQPKVLQLWPKLMGESGTS